MTDFFNNQALRSVIGVVASLLIGGTFLVAAAGPAIAGTPVASQVNIAAESNIVRGH